MFPEFTTPHFVLREIQASDQSYVFEGLSHPEVIRYYGISFATYEETSVQMEWYAGIYREKKGIWWGIGLKSQPKILVGACGFNQWDHTHHKIEMGYWLLPAYWKKGIMTEVLPAVIRYAFEKMQLHRIEAIVESENSTSGKLLLKLNFQYEGTHRESEFKNGRWIDLEYYARLSTD